MTWSDRIFGDLERDMKGCCRDNMHLIHDLEMQIIKLTSEVSRQKATLNKIDRAMYAGNLFYVKPR